jgi:uncharacterized phage protein (TIGR02220 family)
MNALQLIAKDGEIVTDDCPKCATLRSRVESAERDLDAAEKDLRQKRAQINALKKDRDSERKTYGKREQVMDCFNHWVERTGKTKSKLSADRFDAIKARLNEGYTVEQIKLAIDGAAAYPFVVNAQRSATGTGQKHWDLELVCRGGKRLEDLAVLGHQWRKEQA